MSAIISMRHWDKSNLSGTVSGGARRDADSTAADPRDGVGVSNGRNAYLVKVATSDTFIKSSNWSCSA